MSYDLKHSSLFFELNNLHRLVSDEIIEVFICYVNFCVRSTQYRALRHTVRGSPCFESCHHSLELFVIV